MGGPVAAYLPGHRLHLQHGPIDLIIGADGARETAFEAARARFETVLEELVAELPLLRRRLVSDARFDGSVAQRMVRAAGPLAEVEPLSAMIAVAGAVADEVLEAMTSAAPLRRAYVNNGGDIAVHLAPGERFRIAMSDDHGGALGHVDIDGSCGIATSGAGGRSLSRGIAGSVSVVARNAAAADAAATLIANAVDLDHPGIARVPANELQPDSDLGARLVVAAVPGLPFAQAQIALSNGAVLAQDLLQKSLIDGAALFLQGAAAALGRHCILSQTPEAAHV